MTTHQKEGIGKNCTIEEWTVVGKPTRDPKKNVPLKLGENAHIRSFTVIHNGTTIGDNFQTGHGVMIREDNKIGNKVSIGTHAELAPGNTIGNNVRIHSGCFLEHTTIGNGVFIGPNVTFLDDPHPICPRYEECVLGAVVKNNVSIGGNATILPGVIIGENALIGAGAVVTKDVPPNSVVVGNPAKVIKHISELTCPKGFFKKPYEWRSNK